MKMERSLWGEESASMWRGREGMWGWGQLRQVMGGSESRCSSRTASNYIQSVKLSITLWLACLSSCYSSERSSRLWLQPRDTLQECIFYQAWVCARSHKFFAPIIAYFKQYSQTLVSPLVPQTKSIHDTYAISAVALCPLAAHLACCREWLSSQVQALDENRFLR